MSCGHLRRFHRLRRECKSPGRRSQGYSCCSTVLRVRSVPPGDTLTSSVTVEPLYAEYESLSFERPSDGVLLMTIRSSDRANAASVRGHFELSTVWRTVAEDPATRVAVITGGGKAFSAGGDLAVLENQAGDFPVIANRVFKEASQLVYNMINCEKPIISAINGAAVGAGLAVALLADVSVASRTAKLGDGHVRLGLAGGDHAPIIWPLLCGMAKAKYYLLTSELVTGEEAERIGLVSMCTEPEDVLARALAIADNLAAGPQYALRWTKYAMNNWLRSAGPIFDGALAMEMLNFFDSDVREGIRAMREKRRPKFPSAQSPNGE
jgi:enoyl-CoA hydratase